MQLVTVPGDSSYRRLEWWLLASSGDRDLFKTPILRMWVYWFDHLFWGLAHTKEVCVSHSCKVSHLLHWVLWGPSSVWLLIIFLSNTAACNNFSKYSSPLTAYYSHLTFLRFAGRWLVHHFREHQIAKCPGLGILSRDSLWCSQLPTGVWIRSFPSVKGGSSVWCQEPEAKWTVHSTRGGWALLPHLCPSQEFARGRVKRTLRTPLFTL